MILAPGPGCEVSDVSSYSCSRYDCFPVLVGRSLWWQASFFLFMIPQQRSSRFIQASMTLSRLLALEILHTTEEGTTPLATAHFESQTCSSLCYPDNPHRNPASAHMAQTPVLSLSAHIPGALPAGSEAGSTRRAARCHSTHRVFAPPASDSDKASS